MKHSYSFEFEYTTKQYSQSSSRRTGESNVNVVAVAPSSETLTSSGFLVTVENGNIVWPGYPFTMFLISTDTGKLASFDWKNMSIDDIIIPPAASTKNDCASGSPQPLSNLELTNLPSGTNTKSLTLGPLSSIMIGSSIGTGLSITGGNIGGTIGGGGGGGGGN